MTLISNEQIEPQEPEILQACVTDPKMNVHPRDEIRSTGKDSDKLI